MGLMFVSCRLRCMGCLAGGIQVQPLHEMGEIHIGIHEIPARSHTLSGMFLLLQGPLEPMANPFSHRVGHVFDQMVH